MEGELAQQKKMITEVKIGYEKTITSLHEDMKKIKDEWEHRVYEQDLESQRKVAEVESRQALQISQLQGEYQQMLDNKLAEVQSEAQAQIQKSKLECTEMKAAFESKVETIEKNYIPISKFEEEIEKERKKGKISMEESMACKISIAWARLLWKMFWDGNFFRYFWVLV